MTVNTTIRTITLAEKITYTGEFTDVELAALLGDCNVEDIEFRLDPKNGYDLEGLRDALRNQGWTGYDSLPDDVTVDDAHTAASTIPTMTERTTSQ